MSNLSTGVSIIGGGITGAAAAYRLSELGIVAEVHEAEALVGGEWLSARSLGRYSITAHSSLRREEISFVRWSKPLKLRAQLRYGRVASATIPMDSNDGEAFRT